MLQLQNDPQSAPLSIEALTQLYLGLDFPKKFMIFQNFLPSHVDMPKLNPPYYTAKFPEGSRHIISMLYFILGYFTDGFTDESILGFLSTLSPGQPPTIIFYYARFIGDSIHHQLTKLPTEGVFRYSSYLFHLFLFFQADNFPIVLQKMDLEGKPLSIVLWTSLIRKENSDFTYTEFSDLFLHPAMNILYKSEQPRFNEEMKRILQLSEQNKMGDWFLYEKHTKIRIFGSNLLPYKLLKYMNIRIFAFGYLRQILNSKSINFLAERKKTQFKLKNQVGPFIINNREAEKEISKRLVEFKFQEIFHGTMILKGY